jgi:hypothetical protein
VLVVGVGKRVREAVLPVLHRMEGRFVVRRLFSRTRKDIEVEGREYAVAPLAELTRTDLEAADLVYLAVAKDAVPEALSRLVEHDVGRLELLIDTPVVRLKHFHHISKLARFRDAWVPEDCARLPWFDTVQAALRATGERLEHVVFDRSAYAYHGIASAKALLGAERVLSARRRRAERTERELRFAHGMRATIVEPRDYCSGKVELHCGRRVWTDVADLRPVLAGARVVGFELAGAHTELDTDESELTHADPPDPEDASVTARMQAMKRVGLLRLLRDVHAGRGAYPVESALEDMVVDYWLERLGRYRSTALTDPRRKPARAVLGCLSRFR